MGEQEQEYAENKSTYDSKKIEELEDMVGNNEREISPEAKFDSLIEMMGRKKEEIENVGMDQYDNIPDWLMPVFIAAGGKRSTWPSAGHSAWPPS